MKYLLIILALTLTASARYNETEKQCAERYGEPAYSSTHGGLTHNYKVKTITITCAFFNGKCYKISYRENHLRTFLNTKDILKLYGITKVKVPVFKDGYKNSWSSKEIKGFLLKGSERWLEIKNLKIEEQYKESLKSKTGNTEGL